METVLGESASENLIYPVILAGGSGSRLWPVSRQSYPKQFSQLFGSESLFQQAASRVSNAVEISFTSPVTVTSNAFRFIVADQLQSVGVDPGAIIIEPDARNTAPAILAAAMHVNEIDPNGIIVVSPSDHLIPDSQAFHKMLSAGIPSVEDGNFVTFGVTPKRPETGYGYIQFELKGDYVNAAVTRFVEKPSLELAKSFIESGDYLWNSGIFMFRAKDLCASFQKFCPEITVAVSQSFQKRTFDIGFIRLEESAWQHCPDISIDHAVMEKAENISVVPFSGSWSDLGSWCSVWEESDLTVNGVSATGNVIHRDCHNSLMRTESPNQQMVCIGLENIVAIAMQDAVLVASKNKVQDVKGLVQVLNEKGVPQGNQLPKEYRPWGWFETFALSDRFRVKQIHVFPSAALSLQSHKFRSEHWVIIDGTATVTIDDEKITLQSGQSIYIPSQSKHRLENLTADPLELIEVQIGSYFGEDDIVRYDDVYNRGNAN